MVLTIEAKSRLFVLRLKDNAEVTTLPRGIKYGEYPSVRLQHDFIDL